MYPRAATYQRCGNIMLTGYYGLERYECVAISRVKYMLLQNVAYSIASLRQLWRVIGNFKESEDDPVIECMLTSVFMPGTHAASKGVGA